MEEINEEEILKFWDNIGAFKPHISQKKKFFITVPWPYTSGPLHVGHGRTYTIADIVARYKRATGFNVLFPMGFHESGTPIGAISEKIRKGDNKTREMYSNYVREYETEDLVEKRLTEFQEPMNVAEYFSQRIIQDFKSLGYSIDWSKSFRSIDPMYQKMVEWQFRKLDSLGYITKGEYPVLFSKDDNNPVGEDDIDDGDTNKVAIEEFTSVIFKGENFSIAASSLRPETIFGITNLWANPDAKYVIVSFNDLEVCITKEAAEKLSLQVAKLQVIREIENNGEIFHQIFESPITGNRLKIYENRFIDPDNATGIVYSVPGHSVNDLYYTKELGYKIEPIYIIKVNGIISKADTLIEKTNSDDIKELNSQLYRTEFYQGEMTNTGVIDGISVQDAREKIKKDLLQQKSAFIFYETSRKAFTRDGKKVTVAVIRDQWFIDYSNKEWKKLTGELIENMDFIPSYIKNNMADILEWIRQRPCARRRGLGTNLPMDKNWVIESLSDSTIYPAFYTIRELLTGMDLNSLTDQFFDQVYLAQSDDNSELKKIQDSFNYWYPVDLRVTAQPHLSNHLIFYLMNHTAIFKRNKWPGGLMISGLVTRDGAKISKSKGNAISLLDISRNYGADVFRMYVALASDVDSTMDWNEKGLQEIRGRYEQVINMLGKGYSDQMKDSIAGKLFHNLFLRHFSLFLNYMEKYRIREAYVELIYGVINTLNEMKKIESSFDYIQKEDFVKWITALSFVIPFSSEHFWKKFELGNTVNKSEIETNVEYDEQLIREYEYCKSLISDIMSIKKILKNEKTVCRIMICGENLKREVEEILSGGTKVKRKEIIGIVRKNRGKIITEVKEKEGIEKYRKYIEASTGLALEVIVTDDFEKNKVPLPGRPVISLE
ncbi:leucine--tRNA ligase [Caldiplasma sukawensis]